MYLMRQFGGNVSHKVSPTPLIAVTARLAARRDSTCSARPRRRRVRLLRRRFWRVGTAFWWPTMLGITSERFPRGGALVPGDHRRVPAAFHGHLPGP